MNTLILFDLEQTLIDDWSSRELWDQRNPAIKKWLASMGPFAAGLLSFAVWDAQDLNEFNRCLRAPIEQAFGFEFNEQFLFIKNDLLARARVWERKPFLDSSDFDDFFNKRKIVEDLWLNEFQQPHTQVVLLDDTVPNICVVADDVDNCRLQLVNPLSKGFQQRFG